MFVVPEELLSVAGSAPMMRRIDQPLSESCFSSTEQPTLLPKTPLNVTKSAIAQLAEVRVLKILLCAPLRQHTRPTRRIAALRFAPPKQSLTGSMSRSLPAANQPKRNPLHKDSAFEAFYLGEYERRRAMQQRTGDVALRFWPPKLLRLAEPHERPLEKAEPWPATDPESMTTHHILGFPFRAARNPF